MDYYAIVTNQGKTKIAKALQSGTALTITKFCVGDGGGTAVTPSASQTKLVNQKWIGNVTSYTSAGDTISATTVVPANVGTFTVREMGIIDSDGDLFAVANVPDTVKNNSSSILSTLNLTISVKVDNANTIKFTVVESNNDYCICKTAADEVDKVADCDNFALVKGKRVVVEFTNVNTADNATLNINNTGAKALRLGGTQLKANMLLANQPYELVFDGTAYEVVGSVLASRIIPVSLGKDTVSLNEITEIGDYYAGGGNKVVDFPTGSTTTGSTNVGGFTLRVCQSGDAGKLQTFLNQNGIWFRTSRDVSAKTWNSWVKIYSSVNPVKINGTVFDGTNDITVSPAYIGLASKDLNTITVQGFYGGGANNNCTNLPTGVTMFMLIVLCNSDRSTQLLVDTPTQKMYIRNYYNKAWQDWACLSVEDHTHSNTDIIGLGNCATRNLATTVAQGNANPVTSSAVYSAISNIKTNNRTHIVIATYDTKNPLKLNADYTCTETNATDILKQAIISVGEGGKIELLDGTYNLSYSAGSFNIYKSITIEGQGFKTVINQPADTVAGETMPIFDITAPNISIRNMMLSASRVTSPTAIITQSAQGTIYDNVFFIRNTHESEPYSVCIEGTGDCRYTRIQNCRVYKDFKGESVMFDYISCTDFSGVIGANISSGYDNIGVRFKNETHKNATAIYGHSNIDIKTKEV